MDTFLTRTKAAVNVSPRAESLLQRTGPGRWLLLAVVSLAATGLPAYAVSREVSIIAPASALAGAKVSVSVEASTNAGGGERVGFFHADYSTDGGTTWTAISYATNEGADTSHTATFKVGAAGSMTLIRVRVAFRGGRAGDVDFSGKKIEWKTSWNEWQKPPAKVFTIRVVAP